MLNLGSYNYLGFADDWGKTCRPGVMPVLDSLPVGTSINRHDYGERQRYRIEREKGEREELILERLVRGGLVVQLVIAI